MFTDPSDDDVKRLAEQCVVASQLALQVSGRELDRSLADLDSIQRIVDAAVLAATQTYELQCLGIAFGCVLAASIPDLDWSIIDDEYGRDPTLRLGQSSIQINCLTMISKRVEAGDTVDLHALFEGVVEHVASLRPKLDGN
jgi:hypothetical protein